MVKAAAAPAPIATEPAAAVRVVPVPTAPFPIITDSPTVVDAAAAPDPIITLSTAVVACCNIKPA